MVGLGRRQDGDQANCRELVDNISDVAHFATVHRAPIDYFANLFEDHKATQLMVGRSEKQR